MHDFYKNATIEISLPYLSDMVTKQAREMEYLDAKCFMVVTSVEANEDNDTLTFECDIFRYLEN